LIFFDSYRQLQTVSTNSALTISLARQTLPRMIHTLTNSCPAVGLVLAVDFDEWFAGWDFEWKEKVSIVKCRMKFANHSSILARY